MGKEARGLTKNPSQMRRFLFSSIRVKCGSCSLELSALALAFISLSTMSKAYRWHLHKCLMHHHLHAAKFQALFKHSDVLDVNSLYSNDLDMIWRCYGIEACARALVKVFAFRILVLFVSMLLIFIGICSILCFFEVSNLVPQASEPLHLVPVAVKAPNLWIILVIANNCRK